jgi:hypothetical protein
MEAEVRRYDNVSVSAPEGPDPESAYRPGPMSKQQLVQAANEFVKRCRDEAEEAAETR